MVPATSASHFWSAVEDCLVEFHWFEREKAAERVTSMWRQLPREMDGHPTEPSFEDMIYHAEPWYIACNLADRDLPIEPNEARYRHILQQNHLG